MWDSRKTIMKIGKFLRRFDTDEGELCDAGRVARYVLEGIEYFIV